MNLDPKNHVESIKFFYTYLISRKKYFWTLWENFFLGNFFFRIIGYKKWGLSVYSENFLYTKVLERVQNHTRKGDPSG